jgi:5-methylcytosine-specific restriction endonuclease McrA
VGHHKDHNSHNNVIENLVLLCKQCHQIEHECWKAFQCS